MDNKKLVFTSLIVLALVVAALSITYALNVGVTQNDTSDYDLSYTFDISDNATWTINIEAGKTKIYDIAVTNPYNDSIKYGIVYKLNNPTTMPDNSLVGILSDSENPSEGIIEANSSKNISVAVVNGSTSNMQVTLAIVNGYKNGGELIIPSGYTLITEEYDTIAPALRTVTKLGLAPSTGTPDFSKTSCSEGCNENTVGLYSAEDDFGTSYYFRGDVENNYVYFAGFYWRIIRINGDGSIRMIYTGTSAHENGSSYSNDMSIGESAFNSSFHDNAYVGYMYGATGASTYDEAHANTNNSSIKTYLDNWYNTNIKGTTNEQYIVDTIYCNDREVSTVASSYTGDGSGTTKTAYKAYNRLQTNKTPTLKCNQVNDRFTKRTMLYGMEGNGKLENPIGLITADEVAYAGGVLVTTNFKYYLYIGNSFWTMSPYNFDGSNAYEFIVDRSGLPGTNFVNSTGVDVRPVISISGTALNSGTGTMSDPFEILSKAKQTLTLLNLTEASGTPDFSKASCSSGCGETTVGIYKTQDDFGDTYYFRGDVENNYVYFAGFYWRIIRINGDGSIRMIYAGTSAHPNGYDDSSTKDMSIGTSAFNNTPSDNAYVGYMYGTAGASTYDETHSNTNNSTIKTTIDNWYNTNIKGTSNEQYVVDTIYCNDRELDSGTGVGKTATYYKAYYRNYTNKTPSLKCNQENDRFTVNSKVSGITGNGALTNPIGLITIDEAAYAGGSYYRTDGTAYNLKYYLYTKYVYRTMSPNFFVSNAAEFSIDNFGSFGNYNVINISGVRPVISISPDNLEGTGTMNNPFKISNENQTLTSKQVLTKLGLTENTGTPDFSKTSCSSGCEESTVGIYKTQDDFGDTYYFRGDVENNYVYFANKYWRIIRINGDGSIRMIYAGTSAHPNGYDDSSTKDMSIGKSAFNNSTIDNAYVGYMYGTTGSSTYSLTHSNTNNSTIKTTIDNWYNTNIKNTDYEQYVVDTIYCNDRSIDPTSSGTGTAKSVTDYGVNYRLDKNKTPSLNCPQENDRFTVNSIVSGVTGNGALTNPIALITADEVAYAGGKNVTSNSKYYLYTNNYYWTMSPSDFDGSYASGVRVGEIGSINFGSDLAFTRFIRVVISLSSSALQYGNGTSSNPFRTNSAI